MAFNVASPTYPSDTVVQAFDSIKENFNWIRRNWMQSGCIPIHGATISYTYVSGNITAITFGGTLAGSAAFTYSGADLVTEVWTLYSVVTTITHTYSSGTLTGSSVTVV